MSLELSKLPYSADGRIISEGDVLHHVSENCRGVVIRVVRPGDRGTVFDAIGDINIKISRGTTRVTNIYSDWRIIPREEQTYEERYYSWFHRVGWDPELYSSDDVSSDEAFAINGIMSLFPVDPVDGTWDTPVNYLSDAIRYLAEHLDDLQRKESNMAEDIRRGGLRAA